MLVRSSSEFLNRAEHYSLFDGLYFYYLSDSYFSLTEWQSQHKVEGRCAASRRERRARLGSFPFSTGELHMGQGIIC